MTLHPVRMTGLTIGVPQTFTYFQRMQDRIAGFVADNSDMTKERYIELCMKTDELVLDIGSVLDGKSAVDEGLVNELGSLSKSISALYDMIEEMNTPNQA
jgi:ATP-dependent protease ClpP protease subunit